MRFLRLLRRARGVSWATAAAAALATTVTACVPGRGPALQETPETGPPPNVGLDERDAGPEKRDVDLGDPFAVEGLTPSHGGWTGGTRTVLRGRGFPSKVRVWIGGNEIPTSDVFASDPTRAAIVVPAGKPGPVDVRVRNDATAQERTLAGGFVYDAFVVEPPTGATSGGTRITVKGSGTGWSAGTRVALGGKACLDVAVVAADRIECVTPAQPAGAADVTVTTPDSVLVQVRDAYTYSDSPDGFRGGLSGGALAGNLRVLALDAFTGQPLAGARAIAGGDLATAIVKVADTAGVALLAGAALRDKVTVTVVAKCHQPITFADVPVDTVTAYLTPVLDPTCANGDPPSTGNRPGRSGAQIVGELVWPGGIELQRATWTNVPQPARASERAAAYVFLATGSPGDAFVLPDEAQAITPAADGRRGYTYSVITWPGNVTLYALAGVEDRSVTPPRFTPYVMGVARGISARGGERTSGIDIAMASVLDHTVTLAPQAPTRTSRGPDRLNAQLGVSLGPGGFAVLPWSAKSRALPLANGETIEFIGVPPLAGALATESFVLSAAATTGSNGNPASYLSRVRTTDTSGTLTVGGFPEVPALQSPGTGAWDGTSLRLEATGTLDLVEASVSSAGGLVAWTIVAPGTSRVIALPDLSSPTLGPDAVGLRRGPIQTALYVARIEQLVYGKLRSGQLNAGAWSAYAVDSRAGVY